MMQQQLAEIILAAMMVSLPPDIAANRTTYPEARETAQECTERYEDIAHDMATVVSKQPNPMRDASLLLAITYHESSWSRHVDFGLGKHARGDKGRSWCLAQLNIGTGKTAEGWTGPELVEDRIKCLTAALNAIHRSMRACRRQSPQHWLNSYASGECNRGYDASEKRWYSSLRFLQRLTQAHAQSTPAAPEK